MSVSTSLIGQLDRMAKGRQTQRAAFATGDDFWTKVDATGDETYENVIKGTDMTALDAALAAASFWDSPVLRKWWSLHLSYFQSALSLASPYLATYLATVGWRVPYEAAQAYYEAVGSRVPAQWVFPKGTMVADAADPSASGMHKFFTWTDATNVETQTIVDGALANCYGAVMAMGSTATCTATDPIITLTLTDGTTVDITLSATQITALATQYKQVIVGEQAIGAAGAAAGQKVIPIPSTTGFKAGCYALLMQSDLSAAELVLVASLVANTSITATTDLIGTFAQNDLVWPLAINAVYKSGSLSTDDAVAVYARPDRIIAL